MTWKPHCLGDASPPHLKGRDESEHRLSIEWCEQVELKLLFLYVVLAIFNIFDSIENKRTPPKLLILKLKIKKKTVIDLFLKYGRNEKIKIWIAAYNMSFWGPTFMASLAGHLQKWTTRIKVDKSITWIL
jgi:hypothetical protein